MGTRVLVESWHEDDARAAECNREVMANMYRIDAMMSVYKPDSEVSRVNRQAADGPVRISDELFALLAKANEFSRLSGGAFDVTFASVGYRYDYRAKTTPSQPEIDATLPAVDYRGLKLENGSLGFAHPSTRIDLGGIAKGHAVDQGINILKECGIHNAIVSAGGDSRILGDRRGRPWYGRLRRRCR